MAFKVPLSFVTVVLPLLFFPLISQVIADSLENKECVDTVATCHDWAQAGECSANPKFMLLYCQASCSQCELSVCHDRYEICNLWANQDGCVNYATWMNSNCKISCGKCGFEACWDSQPNCKAWAARGECDANPVWMKNNCKLSCKQCSGDAQEIDEVVVDQFWCEYNTHETKCLDKITLIDTFPLGPSRFGAPTKYYMKDQNQAIVIPKLIYGTAGKQGNTSALIVDAILAGFRAIDTAANPLYYHEAGVGDALKTLWKMRGIFREDIFIQTKFTPLKWQNPDFLPYDRYAPIPTQVEQSVQSSLKNIGTTYIDSLLLHIEMPTYNETMQAWYAMEEFVRNGIVKYIGISNFYDLKILTSLYYDAQIKPAILQNKFIQELEYDTKIRRFCISNNIVYQSYWSLTGNQHILDNPVIQNICHSINLSPEQVLFKYLHEQKIIPLIGTTQKKHMYEDLKILNIKLSTVDISAIHNVLHQTL